MNKAVFRTILLLSLLLTSYTLIAASENLSNLLKQAKEAEGKKLPKSSIKYLTKLKIEAKKSGAKGMYILAVAKIALNEAYKKGNSPKEKINILRKIVNNSEKDVRPILKSILAIWYWHYYKNNRYVFANRTQTAGLGSDDFTTWDLPKLFKNISKLFEESFKHKEILLKSKLSNYNSLIDKGNLPEEYCETLYEFLMFRAIDFYQHSMSSIPEPEDAFEIDTSQNGFAHYKKFLKFNPKTTDTGSHKLKTLKLYQRLIKLYHKKKANGPLIEVDIKRHQFVREYGVGSNKSKTYKTRLKELAKEFKNVKGSGIASHELAQIELSSNNKITAKNICDKTIKKFPNSDSAILCNNLIKEITLKDFSVTIEHTINESNSSFLLKYNNINKVYVKIIKDDWRIYVATKKERAQSLEHLTRNKIKELLNSDAIKSWSTALKTNKTYTHITKKISIPKIPYGFYRIFISEKSDFSDTTKNKTSYSSFWVTDTTVLLNNIGRNIHGLVIDSRSGDPLSNTSVKLYKYQRDNRNYKYQKTVNTDKNGTFKLNRKKSNKDESYYIFVKSKTVDVLYIDTIRFKYVRDKTTAFRTMLFTDRSIYRPGQTIKFKGICYKTDYKGDKYKVSNCDAVTLTLQDSNYQTIKKTVKKSNQFGSFSGQFIIPTKTITGNMYINTINPIGNCTVQVEEYKRPKFEVTLTNPKKEYKLSNLVTITGSAISYSGEPISKAKVKYRVVRELNLPWWWRWIGPSQESKEITHGKVKSDNSGSFKIKFKAVPDRSIDKKVGKSFNFKIEVDVVDLTGETISNSTSVSFGYASLEARLHIDDWIISNQEHKLRISTNTLNGTPINSKGTIKIYKLKGPNKPARKISRTGYYSHRLLSNKNKELDQTDISNWKIDKEINTYNFKTIRGTAIQKLTMSSGAYRAFLKTKDSTGEEVEEELSFIILPDNKTFPVNLPSILRIKSKKVEIGETFEAIWATGHKESHAFISIIHDGQIIKKYWSKKGDSAHHFSHKITDKLKGGFTFQLTFVKENQVYLYSEFVTVPRTKKKLSLSFKSFRNKLKPGEKEKWSIQIKGDNAEHVATEMVATLYDASLDAFGPHSFYGFQHLFWKDQYVSAFGKNTISKNFRLWFNGYKLQTINVNRNLPSFSKEISNSFSYLFPVIRRRMLMMAKNRGGNFGNSDSFESMMVNAPQAESASLKSLTLTHHSSPSKKKVTVRKNLNETAFFYPHLISNKAGLVEIEFTMPEAVTSWKFIGMAHGKLLESGILTEKIITQKEIMVKPNPPRFLRQGDKIVYTAKVSNITSKKQKGIVYLDLENGLSKQNVNKDFITSKKKITFSIGPNSSKTFSWKLNIPNETFPIIHRVIAKTDQFSDGEENMLPILPKKILVKESIPLWIRGPRKSKNFNFKNLISLENSKTAKQHKYVIQMTSNPTWYAIQALPYLEQHTNECTDYLFNRLYANVLGKYIVKNSPQAERVFSEWRKKGSLKSNLETNSDLKNILLNETPWVLEAKNEKQAKNSVGNFFDINKIDNEIKSAYKELKSRKLSDGGWPWMPGFSRNEYITLYIVTGLGRLQHLGAKIDTTLALESVESLDKWIQKKYDLIKDKDINHYSNIIALYLYGRSFFLQDLPIKSRYQTAVNYYLKQAETYWTKLNNRMGEAHTALGSYRFKNKQLPILIIKSLKERALHSKEMGMYWGDASFSNYYWFWYRAPLETQALMIELFSEIDKSSKEIDDMKVWLLKQKQTTSWPTAKSTADAVYALLLNGNNLLNSTKLVEVKVGGKKVTPKRAEIGTGFYEKIFIGKEITPNMGKIEVYKEDKGIAWGGVHLQYFEDLSKIKPHKTNLSLRKRIFVKRNSKAGPVLKPINKVKLVVGDTLTIRIELKVDRDMDFIHLKDMRGSGTEPVNIHSGHRWQDGLIYYESTKDSATHFYFERLNKGTHVFEYDLKIYHKGIYESGMAEIRSLYAPEFSSHSKSFKLTVD